MCSCATQEADSTIVDAVSFRTLDASQFSDMIKHVTSLLAGTDSGRSLRAAGERPGDDSPVNSLIHIADQGDAVLVSSAVSAASSGDVILRGRLASLPIELHLRLSIEGSVITITAEMTKPFRLGPFEWKFNLGGIVRDKQGAIVGAATVTPLDTAMGESIAARGLNWFCVLRCGGLAILPILVQCLPALTGGVPAYVACVTARAGSAAARIALCIAGNCV